MREMKESGISWVGEIPKEWSVNRAKYCFVNTKEIAGCRADRYERLALTMNGVIKRSKDDSNGLQPEKFETYQILRPDELVFKLIDLQNVSTSRVGLSPYLGLVSPAYIILKSNKRVLPAFAEKYFLMLWKNQIFNALGDAGVRSNLNSKDLLELSIPFPPLAEQQRIAEFLDRECRKIDELKADIQAQIDTLEQYKRSVITEAVTHGLNPSAPMKDSGISLVGDIPQNWKIKRLKYLFKFCKGLPITKDNLIDQGLPVISYGQIHAKTNNGVDVRPHLLRFVDFSYQTFYPLSQVMRGDFVFADTSEDYEGCGNCVYKRNDSLLFAGYHTIIAHSIVESDNRFFAYLFQTDIWRKQIREKVSGVKVFSITQKTLSNTYLILPPLGEQQEIADYLDNKCAEIERIIADKKTQIETLDGYKKSLIYEYVTGKKEVL